MNRSLGWLPDEADARDRLFRDRAAELAIAGTLAHDFPALDQGRLGSCVANAGFGAIRVAQATEGFEADLGARLWGYGLARSYDATPLANDDGTHLRTFFYAISKHGFPRERDYHAGYDVARYAESPHPSDYRKAFDQRKTGLVNYTRIDTVGDERLDDIRSCIQAGFPVCFGTSVGYSFTSQGRNDDLWFPPLDEPIAGGHAMFVKAYDGLGTDGIFVIQNSWGDDVGVSGSHRFAASYLAWPGTRDLWAVKFAPSFSQ